MDPCALSQTPGASHVVSLIKRKNNGPRIHGFPSIEFAKASWNNRCGAVICTVHLVCKQVIEGQMDPASCLHMTLSQLFTLAVVSKNDSSGEQKFRGKFNLAFFFFSTFSVLQDAGKSVSPSFCSSILFCFPLLFPISRFFQKVACNFYVISIFVLTVDKQNTYLLIFILTNICNHSER